MSKDRLKLWKTKNRTKCVWYDPMHIRTYSTTMYWHLTSGCVWRISLSQYILVLPHRSRPNSCARANCCWWHLSSENSFFIQSCRWVYLFFRFSEIIENHRLNINEFPQIYWQNGCNQQLSSDLHSYFLVSLKIRWTNLLEKKYIVKLFRTDGNAHTIRLWNECCMVTEVLGINSSAMWIVMPIMRASQQHFVDHVWKSILMKKYGFLPFP